LPTASARDRLLRFLAKDRPDKVRALLASLHHALYHVGLRATSGPGPRVTVRIAADVAEIHRRLRDLAVIATEGHVRQLLAEPRYQDRRRLPPFGGKVYSQNDEDGIIQEIFARIGVRSRRFVEFGVEQGLENNTLRLLLEGWSGLWLEADTASVASIRRRFEAELAEGRLRVRQAFLDRDNINRLIGESDSGEIDLLSIDIDGNDIHLLEALRVVSPRVIVIEYNAKFPPPLSIAQAYEAGHRWRGGDYFGASLEAVARVAERRGYALVGCNITGANAFLVRQDLLGAHFCPPYTAENHYMPARYFLTAGLVAGHPADWGRYVAV
jgi:hypothetical protein